MLNGPAGEWRGKGVVDEQPRPVAVGDFGQGGDVGNDDRRVRDRLHVQHRRAGSAEGFVHGRQIGRIDEFGRDAQARQDAREQVAGRAVDGLRGHDRLPRPNHRDQGRVNGGHTGGEGQARLRALEFGYCGAESGGRGVIDSAVRVARSGAGQNIPEFAGVRSRESCGLVDRDGRRDLIDLG